MEASRPVRDPALLLCDVCGTVLLRDEEALGLCHDCQEAQAEDDAFPTDEELLGIGLLLGGDL